MSSEYSLFMDFQKARKQADEISALANDMRRLGNNDLAESLARISTFWTGDNASKFVGKGNLVKEKTLKVAGQLDEAAGTIRTIARQTYEAEMEALRLAQEAD